MRTFESHTYKYTGFPRVKVTTSGQCSFMLKYTDTTPNTYVQS